MATAEPAHATREKAPDVPGAAGTSYKRPVRLALGVSHDIESPVTEALRVRPG